MDDWLELCRKALDSDDVLSVAPRDEFAKMLNAYDALRAQLHADDQRAWEALGKPEGTYDTTNVQRLCAEVERLRAELRAVATIAHEGGLAQLGEGPPLTAIRRRTLCWWVRTGSLADAQARVRAAMKHKETDQ